MHEEQQGQQYDVYLGIGSNLGERAENVLLATSKISKILNVKFVSLSTLYETKGSTPQHKYINAVCKVTTTLEPKVLFEHIAEIEKQIDLKFGNVSKPKENLRIIDIDILHYGSLLYEQHGIKIPHPEWRSRMFVLYPLSQLTPKIKCGPQEFDLRKEIERLLKGK